MGVEKLVNYDFAKGESSERIFQVVFVVAKEFLDRQVMFYFEEKNASHPLRTFNPTLQPDRKTVAQRNSRLTLFYTDTRLDLYLVKHMLKIELL